MKCIGQLTLGVGKFLLVAMRIDCASEIDSRDEWLPHILVKLIALFSSLTGRQGIGGYDKSSVFIEFFEVLIKTLPHLSALAFKEKLGYGESIRVECIVEVELLTSDDLGLQLWHVNFPHWEVNSTPIYLYAAEDLSESSQEFRFAR